MSHTQQRPTRTESIGSFASAVAAGPAAARDAATFCAWRGSLPWHVLPAATLQQLLERSGSDAAQARTLARRFDPHTFLSTHAHRDLIEQRTLHELAHGFIAHTDHWFVRMTQHEARAALQSIISRLQQNERYELGITRSELPWSIVLRQSRSAEMWGAREDTGSDPGRVLSRSTPLVSALATYFENLWHERSTIQRRDQVLDLLATSLHALEHRRVF